MAKSAIKSEDNVIQIGPEGKPGVVPQFTTAKFRFTIIGDSILIHNKFSTKAKEQMAEKQQKAVRVKKAPKNPEQLFLDSLHVVSGKSGEKNAVYGIPATAIKASIVTAGMDADYKKTQLRRAFFVNAPGAVGASSDELVPIKFSKGPIMREDTVRLQTGVCDLRYRGSFEGWSAEVEVTYNPKVISREEILYLADVAGFGVGLLENRPERNGSCGRFHVARVGE